MGTRVPALALVPFLRNVAARSTRENPKTTPLRIGLCVSGGPDSMALAYLVRNVNQRDLGIEIKFTAFVINHNIRAGSKQEADKVCDWLGALGKGHSVKGRSGLQCQISNLRS